MTKYQGIKQTGLGQFYHVSDTTKVFGTAEKCGREFNAKAFTEADNENQANDNETTTVTQEEILEKIFEQRESDEIEKQLIIKSLGDFVLELKKDGTLNKKSTDKLDEVFAEL